MLLCKVPQCFQLPRFVFTPARPPLAYTNPLAVGDGEHIGQKVSWRSAKLGHAFLDWGDFFKKKKKKWMGMVISSLKIHKGNP